MEFSRCARAQTGLHQHLEPTYREHRCDRFPPLTRRRAGRTDPSKLNSALAARSTEVERSACFDEVNVDLGEL
jgi:hypothetical protein